jgi:hypothetical protein
MVDFFHRLNLTQNSAATRADAVAQSGRPWQFAHVADVVGPDAGHVDGRWTPQSPCRSRSEDKEPLILVANNINNRLFMVFLLFWGDKDWDGWVEPTCH